MRDYIRKISATASASVLMSIAILSVTLRTVWEIFRSAADAGGIFFLPDFILTLIFLSSITLLIVRQNSGGGYSLGMLTNSLIKILFLTFGLVFLSYVLPVQTSDILEENFWGIIFSNAAGAFAAYTAGVCVLFLVRNISYRQSRAAEKKISILGLIIIAIAVASYAEKIFDKDISPIPGFAVLGLVIYFNIVLNTSQLVATITKEEKIRVIWLSILGIMLAFIASARFEGADELGAASEKFFPLLASAAMMIFILMGFFLLRLLISALAALPTAKIVEQRSSESSSLVYLNRLIAESAGFEKILQAVTQLAQQISGATTAWTELYEDSGERKIQSAINIKAEQINFLHQHEAFHKLAVQTERAVVVESVGESEDLYALAPYISPVAQSLVIVPIFDGAKKIGSLIVTHSNEYAFAPETVRILAAFADNINIAIENSRLWRASLDKERYERELQIARQMQKKLLPQKLPDIRGYEISARSEMAQEVGGDYYDVLTLKDGRDCILIGDVSGKGIAAAFIMAKLQGVVLSLAKNSDSPKELLERINSTLFGNMERPMYITLSCVAIEREPGALTIARAGHTPVLVRQDNSTSLMTPQGLGIGLSGEKLFNSSLEQKKIFLQPGDSILLITDGINERSNPGGRDLGYDNLLNVLRSPSSSGADSIVDEVFRTAEDFAHGIAAHDDMTAVALFYKGLD